MWGQHFAFALPDGSRANVPETLTYRRFPGGRHILVAARGEEGGSAAVALFDRQAGRLLWSQRIARAAGGERRSRFALEGVKPQRP